MDFALANGQSFALDIKTGTVEVLRPRLCVPTCKTCFGTTAAENDSNPPTCTCEEP